jgi:hypothetical protein
MARHLRVDEDELLDAADVFEREIARERAARVLREHGIAVEAETVDERLQGAALAGKAEIRRVRPLQSPMPAGRVPST